MRKMRRGFQSGSEKNKLNDQFLEALKVLFRDKEIEIVVSEMDETDYLMRSEANRERLLRAIPHVNSGEELIEVRTDDMQ